MVNMTAIEHKELRGLTVKTFIWTIVSTISIVASVMTTYFNLKGDLTYQQNQNETSQRITDIRLKVLESQVLVLQQQVTVINQSKK
jgi:putative exporter of polyketide antibiotics